MSTAPVREQIVRDATAWYTRNRTHLQHTPPAAAAAAGALALAVVVGLLTAAWQITTGLLDTLADTARTIGDASLVDTVTNAVRNYIDTHTAGLPVTAGQLWWTWLTATAVLFLTAWSGSYGARIGWTLIGAATTAMAWAGSATDNRELVAGLVVTAWSLLSILAFTGAGRPRHTVVYPDPDARRSPAASL